MEKRIGIGLAALVLATACHRGSSTMQREQKSYQVVSEGQASGVSSTINAPGETPAPMTNTSADTTSNFTLAPNVDTSGTAPTGNLAGTMPVTTTVPTVPPRVITTTQPQQPPRIVITNTKPPARTDTTATTATTSTTSTTGTTATQPPPPRTDTTATEEKHSESDEPQNPPPPPPPTQTDTRGW